MKGFDYNIGKPVDRPRSKWRQLAKEAARKGGFTREDRDLGETLIHERNREGRATIRAEVYEVNLNL